MRRLVLLGALAGACGVFRPAPDVPPRTSSTPRHGDALALVTFEVDAKAPPLSLRLRHADDSRTIDVAAGSRVVELREGDWEALDLCQAPCDEGAVHVPVAPEARFHLEADAVNDLGVLRVGPSVAEFRDRAEGKAVLAAGWPSLTLPVRRARAE